MINFKFFQGSIYAEVDVETAEDTIECYEDVFIFSDYPEKSMNEIELHPRFYDSVLYVLLGGEQELTADYQETVARNNEQRSFECWLEDKIG